MKHIFKILTILTLSIFLASCDSFNDENNPYEGSEVAKDLSGVWKIMTVTRNGVDITKDMDFSQFTLHLNENGTYKIDNYLPFVVQKDGNWSTDNPDYPFRLSFTEKNSSSATTVNLNYPTIKGSRNLLIKLSPGCSSNSYMYQMERTSNQ